MKRLNGKKALITGGAGEIGLATAKAFLENGADVFLVDIDREGIENAKHELGEKVKVFIADVTKASDVQAYVSEAMNEFGSIDIFFNNAGIEGAVAPIPDYPEDVFDQILNVNVKGVLLGMKYVMPEMIKQKSGSIIISSSVAGLKGVAGLVGYNTAKHAVVGIMRTAAIECAPHGVRVNCINPAPVDNRMMRSLEEGFAPGAGSAAKAQLEAGIPFKRYASNEDVASLVTFLASEESSYITGCCEILDGGMML